MAPEGLLHDGHGRRRRRAGRDHPRGGLAQGAEAPRQRAGLPAAAADDERDRRL